MRCLHLTLQNSEYDIIFVTETWLNDKIFDSEILNGTNYEILRLDRSQRIGGGVAIFYKSCLKIKRIILPEQFNQCEILACDLILDSLRYRLVVCYRPPSFSYDESLLFSQALEFMSRTVNMVVILGDFNIPEIKWDKRQVFNPETVSFNFQQTIYSLGLSQLVKQPTLGNNILDLLFCSHKPCIKIVEVLEPFSTSDHNSIHFQLSCSSVPLPSYRKLDFAKGDYDGMNLELSSILWPIAFCGCANVDDFYRVFHGILAPLIDKYVPLRKPPSRFRYPRNIRLLQAKKRHVWKKCKTNADLKNKYRALNTETEKAIRDFYASKENNLLKKGSNLKNFYNFVNKKLNVKSSIPDIELHGSTISDSFSKANAFNNFFGSVFTTDNGNIPIFGNNNNYGLLHPFSVKFSPETVFAALKKLKPSLASGPDGINAFVLKKLKFSLMEPLSTIFEVSYRTGKLPDLWLQAIVNPIFKKGSPYVVENYRPISLCCVTCKVMESIINKSLVDFMEVNCVLKKQQYGFRKNKSCTLQLLNCLNNWSKALDNSKTTDVVYIDFQKAFDTVVHSKLLYKLENICPNRFLVPWIKSFLSNRTQVVMINQIKSDSLPVTSGVPQGSVLGPTLFLLYINDLVDIIKHSQIQLFADDLKVFNTSENSALLQSDLDNLCSWASEWQLSIALSKSNVLYVGKRNPKLEYNLGGHILEDIGPNCKDLGVYISANLDSSVHCENIVSKASRISGLIHRSFISKDRNLKVQAFKTYVRPILEYASVVWNPHLLCDINNIEKVQRRFTKRLFYNSALSYDERLKQLNLDRLELRRMYFDVSTAYNIIRKNVLPFNDFFSLPHSTRTRSHDTECLYIEKFRLDVRKYSFAVRAVHLWNNLPIGLKNSLNLENFKKGLDYSMFCRNLKGRK
jgi:Reverse transcriptase (RNA-dependent DNA polymerase)/Endonuclease-reverse transcriptase